jgi:lipoprotein YgeR
LILNLARRGARGLALVLLLSLAACGTTGDADVPAGFYRVKSGDTLYRIALNHKLSVATLKSWNKLSSNDIEVGQVLRVSGGTAPAKPPVTASKTNPPARVTPAPPPQPSIDLIWPHRGAIVANYAPPRNKGIGIAGNEGDAIVAAADGKVVYAGDGIRAYGNMIIIRHSGDYLTTYAHNQTLLAAEGAQVKKGQVIAKMGNTGTDRVKLHFEVRLKGQPINPLNALPAK